MNITVVGHLCLDVIHHPPTHLQSDAAPKPGDVTQSYGGIFFSVAAIANLVPAGTTIYPIFGVGKNDHTAVLERLTVYSNVDTSGIFKTEKPTNEVHLYYSDHQRRTECSKHIADPIPFKRIKPYLDTNMILVNMVSGFDLTLETLDQVRLYVRETHIPVYLDVHSLTLGINEDFTRFRRPLIDWRRWLFWLHAVQMNEEEREGLTVEKFTEEYFAKQTTALNTRVLIVTRGANGCTAYVDERKHITRHDVPGVPVERTVDATGCGDVFGAAYCAKYVATIDILQSLEFACMVAAFKASSAGSVEIDRLEQFRIERSQISSLATASPRTGTQSDDYFSEGAP